MLAAAELGLAFEGLGEIGRAGIGKARVPIAADQDAVGQFAKGFGELNRFSAPFRY